MILQLQVGRCCYCLKSVKMLRKDWRETLRMAIERFITKSHVPPLLNAKNACIFLLKLFLIPFGRKLTISRTRLNTIVITKSGSQLLMHWLVTLTCGINFTGAIQLCPWFIICHVTSKKLEIWSTERSCPDAQQQ